MCVCVESSATNYDHDHGPKKDVKGRGGVAGSQTTRRHIDMLY